MNIARLVFLFHAIPIVAQEMDSVRVEVLAVQTTFHSDSRLGLAIGTNRMCYVSDYDQNRILKIDTSGVVVAEIGGLGSDTHGLDGPSDIASTDGFNFFVVDENNQRIQRFGRNLEYLGSIQGASLTIRNNGVGRPAAVAVDEIGHLFIADVGSYEILRLNRQQKIDLRYGDAMAGAGRLTLPGRIAISNERLAVVDADRLAVFDYYGKFLFDVIDPQRGRPLDVALGTNHEIWILYPGTLVRYSKMGHRQSIRRVPASSRAIEIRSDIFILQADPPAILRFRPGHP